MTLANKAGVIALQDDVHAQAVCHLARVRGKSIYHFASDRLHEAPSSVSFERGRLKRCEITDITGVSHDLSEFQILWWRRPYGPQVIAAETDQATVGAVINNSAKSHIEGLVRTAFPGCLINEPVAAQMAENKIVQLHVAGSVGFLTPRSLFSNDFESIVRFHNELGGRVVVKSHYNSNSLQLRTSMLSKEMLREEASLRISPAIYQEYIDGDKHFRVFAIRDQYQAVRFVNPELDSRNDLSVPAEKYRFDESISDMIKSFLRKLELEMGIFDFKMSERGDLYFLEVNQQGQFAYMDVIANTECLEIMASRLLDPLVP